MLMNTLSAFCFTSVSFHLYVLNCVVTSLSVMYLIWPQGTWRVVAVSCVALLRDVNFLVIGVWVTCKNT